MIRLRQIKNSETTSEKAIVQTSLLPRRRSFTVAMANHLVR